MGTLGGKHSSFTMGPGTSFAFQHDVRVRADNDAVLTLFDNGGDPPRVKDQSRGLALALELKHMAATRTDEYGHTSALPANFEGNVSSCPAATFS
jgi:Arylsulfotransferase (ASST)